MAARYLAGYAGRDLGDERRLAGLHRYEVAQGFQPEKILCYGVSAEDVIERASRRDGGRAGAGLVLVVGGGVAWAASLLGAVGLTTSRPARWPGSSRPARTQGVPVKLSDPLALARVAELLAQGRKTGSSRDSSKRL